MASLVLWGDSSPNDGSDDGSDDDGGGGGTVDLALASRHAGSMTKRMLRA